MKIEPRLGLSPEEMFTIFTRMYQDEWAKHRDHVPISDKELEKILIPVFEVVVTAVRDSMILTLYENNERIYEALERAGLVQPKGEKGDPEPAGKSRSRKKSTTDKPST